MITRHQSNIQNHINGSDLFDLYVETRQSVEKTAQAEDQNNIHSFLHIIFLYGGAFRKLVDIIRNGENITKSNKSFIFRLFYRINLSVT